MDRSQGAQAQSSLILALAFAFTACADIDVPLPGDGQIYACTLHDADTGEQLETFERCGSWFDWRPTAEALLEEQGRLYDVRCYGTHHACEYAPPED